MPTIPPLHGIFSFPEYIVISAGKVRAVNIPNPKFQFNAPTNLTKGSQAILSFVYIIDNTQGNEVNFFVQINGTEVVNYSYKGPFLMAQAVHQVFDASIISTLQSNSVSIGMADDTAGVVTLSNLVLWLKVDVTI